MRRALLLFFGTAALATALLALAQATLGRHALADGAFLPLVLLALAADLALPLLLFVRGGAAWTARLAAPTGGALAGVLIYVLFGLRPGDPGSAPRELGAIFLLYSGPWIAAAFAARGARPAAVAVSVVTAAGMALVYLAARRFGAFDWGHPFTQLLEAAMIGFILAGLLATWSALRTGRRDREP